MLGLITNAVDTGQRRALDFSRAIVPSALPAYATVMVMTTFIALSVIFSSFRYDAGYLNSPILSLVLIGATGIVIRLCGHARAGSGIEAIAVFGAIILAAPLYAVVLASSNLPLVDETLARLDRQLFFGFNRTDFAYWVASHEGLFAATKWVYHSLMLQPWVLLGLLFTAGMEKRGWQLLFAWGLTLFIVITISPLTPALGSPPYFLDFEDTFHGARDGSLRIIGREALTGIVTFPSFHAAAAVLLAWGFAGFRYIGPVLVGLNVLMWLSAIVAGHYLIDLVAGSVIAIVAIAVSRATINRIETSEHKIAEF